MKEKLSVPGKIALALGKGIIAGLAGTLAITVSQAIEMQITNRKPSTAPADAASKVLDVKAVSKEKKEKLANEVHWAYGTIWGIARGLLDLTGLKGNPATLSHFVAIWITAMIMPPKLGISPPVTEWKPKEIATDGIHHLVYSTVTGQVYDAMHSKNGVK